MARRTSTVSGNRANGEAPPPSTLAAQIVQNGTRPVNAASQQNVNTAAFHQMLQGILTDPDANQETDLQVNVQLIRVVTTAGLTVLTADNPFAQWDLLVPAASDSITVIEATVQRQPEVLLAPCNQDGPPLVLWLLARLAAICGRQRCEDLPIRRLLESCSQRLSISLDLWQYDFMLQQVIMDCVEGM